MINIRSNHRLTFARRMRAVLGALAIAASPFLATEAPAADPYDTSMERRVQALERELDILQGDKKGKNVEEAEVPTFLRAGSKNVKELVISGEVRFRYEYGNSDGQAAATADTHGQISRERFRFRLFADYKLTDNFFLGAAAQTSLSADSGNTTFSEGFDNYSLFLWRAFLGWKINDNLTIVGGKIANPFYSNSELLWDADISPTGIAEQLKFPVSSTFEVDVNLGQFIFYDNNENATRNLVAPAVAGGAPVAVRGGNNNTDSYLLYGQVQAIFTPSNKLGFDAAIGFMTYADNGGTASPNTPGAAGAPVVTGVNYAPPGNQTGQAGNVLQNADAFNSPAATRDLWLGTTSLDTKLTLGKIKVKLYADAVYNFRGGARTSEVYGLPGYDSVTDKLAFATGLTVGSDFTIKKKGDYLLLAEYRQVGLGSIDPNINDSDFNGSRLGFRGVKMAGSYAFYPWLIGTVTGYFNDNLGRERNINFTLDNFNASQLLQVDLTARF